VQGRIETFFSEADREAILAATTAAEHETAAEIVVYVAERCDRYPELGWKAALIGGALGAMCAALGAWWFGGWGAADHLRILIGLQVGLVLGWAASRFDPIARRLIGGESLEDRVEGRAAEAFLEEQVFATRERSGVLIFVALFEHRVVILADQGIDERVEENAWAAISDEVAAGVRRRRPAEALVAAVQRCADLLVEHGISPKDSRNELPNEPRFRRE
jgi:putative membrane protein